MRSDCYHGDATCEDIGYALMRCLFGKDATRDADSSGAFHEAFTEVLDRAYREAERAFVFTVPIEALGDELQRLKVAAL